MAMMKELQDDLNEFSLRYPTLAKCLQKMIESEMK